MNITIRFTLAVLALLAIATDATAQYNEISCVKRPFTTRLVQVDQVPGSTVFYFEMVNDGRPFNNVYEDIIVRDDNNTYRLLNSYNMPLSDEDISRQIMLKPQQTHRFALEFEPVPVGKEFDIIESESNTRALNFYEVRVDTTKRTDPIDYDRWIRDYPVKEHGYYVEDGSVIQYISYKGLMLTARMQQTNEHGKYYTVDLDVQNNSPKDVLLDPARITAHHFSPKKKKDEPLKVLSAEDYDKKIKSDQAWTTAFVVAAGIAITAAVAAAESDSHDYRRDDRHHHDSPHHHNSPRHQGWRPAHSSHHPYYPTDHYRSHYHSNDMGGLATATAAISTIAAAAAVGEAQKSEKQQLEAEYIKANTIRRGQEYIGYFHIKHEKTDNLTVSIPMMGEAFEFQFQWQNKK